MATPAQVEAWILQAEADLAAAQVQAEGLAECHRRYWLQQGYEKAVKAYALMRWRGSPPEDREFALLFLRQHSPLKSLDDAPSTLSKSLHLLRREIQAFVGRLDQAVALFKIDSTTPRLDPGEVSYRYPFHWEGRYIAPATFGGWDDYQGDPMGSRAAVKRLLAAVKNEFRVFSRAPG